MYICNFCDYDTNDKSNINHHNKTKKHITNKKLYDKINNLEKKDLVIDKDTEKQIKLLNSENEKLKQELLKIKEEKEKEKQIIQLETKVEIYKELSEKGKNINNNNGVQNRGKCPSRIFNYHNIYSIRDLYMLTETICAN